MSISPSDLIFNGDESLFRRVSKSDIHSSRVHARTIKPHVSVNRERYDAGGQLVKTAKKDGVASVKARAVRALQTEAMRAVLVYDPNGDDPGGRAHTLIAFEGTHEHVAPDEEEFTLRTKLAEAMGVVVAPTK